MVTFPDGSKNLVIAGGGGGDSSTTILNLDTLLYTPGPDLPTSIIYGSSIQFDDTLLIVGGFDGESTVLDTIYEFDTTNQLWIERPEKMKRSNYAMAALLVPDYYFQCV